MREIDQRFNILGGVTSQIDDPRSARHTDHSLLQLLRQRVYQVAAGYENCNDADHLRVDPALRLALGKEHESGACQSALSRFESNSLKKLIQPHLKRPIGRPPKSGVQIRVIEFPYQAEKWNKPRRVVCKIEWRVGELFHRVGFIVTNSKLKAERVITIYNGRAEIENRIKEAKNTLRWDKTSCHRFAANQARLLVGCLAYNLLHIIRDTAFWGENVKPSIESIIRRLVKVGARVVYHARRWYVHVATAFSLARYYRILFA